MQEQLKLLEHQQVNACMMSIVSLHQGKSEEKLSTVELAPEIKDQILNLKSNILEKDTQTTRLSKILVADLISKEKDLMPYWDQSSMEMSQKLLSLTEIGSVASDLTLSNPLQINTIANSWFVTSQNSALKPSLFKTFFPSSTFFPVDFMVLENTLIRSKKIRIYPQIKDLTQFKKYLGLSRYWFNQAISYLKNAENKASLKEVRQIQKQEHPDWAFDCPQRIREHAMSEACEAVKNAKIKVKKTGEFQDVHFRKKKDNNQRFGFDAQSLKDTSLFGMLKYKITFHFSEKENTELEGTKIVCEDHRWFLIIPQKRHIQRPENQRLPFVALDPGVRTFMSFYSPYVYGKIGDGDFKKIYRLCLGLDKIYSKMSKEKAKKKRIFKLAAERQRWKIFDLIDDMHKKTSHFLVTRFSEVVIPSFETSQMVTKLRSKTARSMLSFAHYRFKQFLIAKAEEYSCKIRIVSEAYTSKTCSYCGCIQNIGSKKIFKCSCGVNADRDLQGARGIYLRALGALPWSEHVLTCNC